MSPRQVLDIEHTRATSLDYDATARASFTAEFQALAGLREVGTEQQTSLTMTQTAPRS
jgi:hypothetical protein